MKNLKTILITALILVATPVSAMTLWEYYNGYLPSIQDRAPKYNEYFDDEYQGTAEQNTNFLNALLDNEVDNQFEPSPLLTLGASLPDGVATFQTSLQSAITSGATSMTLTQNSVRGGGTLSGYQCFTVDEGSSIAEYICGTVSGTAVSSLLRGVDPLTGTTTNATLQFSHRRGAEVKVTDFPVIQIMKHQLNGNESLPALLFYTQNFSLSSSTQLAPKGYVDSVSFQGTATSTESSGGIIELGTLSEQADSYDGGSDRPTVLQTKNSTSTCQVVGSYNIVASSTTGKLDKGCFDQTANYNFTGVNSLASTTLTATTTISADSVTNGALKLNGVPYAFPNTQGATGELLQNDGSGNLNWVANLPRYVAMSNTDINVGSEDSYATSTPSLVIPANTLNASSTIQVTINAGACTVAGGSEKSCTVYLRTSGGTTIAQADVGSDSNSLTGYGGYAQFIIGSNNSSTFSSQISQGIGLYGRGSTPTTVNFSSAENTSSVSFTSDVTLKIVGGGASNGAFTITSWSIVVNP